MSFDHMLPRLIAAYDQGILVPFLGAGMSMHLCPGWSELIDALEASVGAEGVPASAAGASQASPDSVSIIRRANAALRQLTLRAATEPSRRMRSALYKGQMGNGGDNQLAKELPQTAALARLRWPLVISSNYDDLFARAYAQQRKNEYEMKLGKSEAAREELRTQSELDYGGYLDVRGRTPLHCAEVLNSLFTTVPSILWAIHGYLPRESVAGLKALEKEMVVGHDAYRRLAHADPYYRRTFGEVWRRRSLLFVGSSLGDQHLLELFSEIQEMYGSTPQPHFALVGPGSSVDAEHLRTRFNILVVKLGSFGELPCALEKLADGVEKRQPRQVQWRWHLGATQTGANDAADLTIVHGGLPSHVLAPDEGLLVSAGIRSDSSDTRAPYLNSGIEGAVEAASGQRGSVLPELTRISDGILEIASCRVCVVQPWRDATTRDLTLLRPQLQEAFDWAADRGITQLRMSLVGSGASRHYPAVVPLALIIRAFRNWRANNSGRQLRIVVHVMNDDAVFELRSGRLDVSELLAAEDIRIWVRVIGPGMEHVLPEPLYVREETELCAIADGLELPNPGSWGAVITPAAVADGVVTLMSSRNTLTSLGVVPGATITVRRSESSQAPAYTE